MTRWLVFAALAMLLWTGPAAAGAAGEPLQLTAAIPRVSAAGRLEHYTDASNALSFDAVRRQAFVRLPDRRSLGYSTATQWFRIELARAADAPPLWIFAIGPPDLENVDVWVEQQGGAFRHYAMGYHRPYENRPVRTRLFAVPVEVSAHTQVYFRVRTTNALNIDAEAWQPGAFTAHETEGNFYRGLYFGILLIAIVLYAILGARLRDVTMTSYAGYIASQALLNLGSNGYLPVLLWSHAAWMSDALPRIGWLGGAIAIVLMWDRLLELKKNHPRIHQLFVGTIFLNIGLIPCALLPGLVNAAVLVVVELANYLNILNFFVSMTLIFISWRRSRRIELAIYFVAFIIPAAGTLINTTMNQGLLPSNVVVVNFYQLASLVHVVVMSFGLGLRLRQLQRDKVAAQQEVAVALRRSEEQRRFVAMLSHEFRNPLAAIDRTAQMIQIKTQDLPQAEAQRLAQIRANVAILSGFVDNFLMTEALDHDALVLTRKPCGIRELIETAVRAQGEPSGKRILLGACPDDAAFPLDPTLIGAAVGNLLANALLYSPAGSQVEISASLDAPEGKGLRIRVADHGPGISEAELAKLGTPYFRAATSLGKKGSGLGYHFTRRIVQAHGGTLTARSPAGGGLQVEIFLP